MKNLVILLASLLFSLSASVSAMAASYYIVPIGETAVNTSRSAHVLVAGFADEADDAFFQSALTLGWKLKELYPEDQVVVLRGDEDDESDTEESMREHGIWFREVPGEDFGAQDLIRFATQFASIRTLAIYSHSNVYGGVRIGEDTARFNPETPHLDRLKAKLSEDAVVAMYGCNSGYDTAPKLSQILGVPVIGSLTATNFEQLFSDGQWYPNDEERRPRSGSWSRMNNISFDQARLCSQGGCTRMRPESHSYTGTWGNWTAGLGIYKGFCVFEDETKCLKGLARAVIHYPSRVNLDFNSSIEQFREALNDYLCPIQADSGVRARCSERLGEALTSTNEVYSPFEGNPVECSMTSCNATFREHEGTWPFSRTTLEIIAPRNTMPRTFIQEYKRLIRGFEALH